MGELAPSGASACATERKMSFDKNSPFKESGVGFEEFMCVDNCLARYSLVNKDLMKTGMPAVGKGFAI